MQSLTEGLLDILASRFEAAASGYRGRVEIDYLIEGFTELGELQDLNLAYGTCSNDEVRYSYSGSDPNGSFWYKWGKDASLDESFANDGNNSTTAGIASGAPQGTFSSYIVSDLGDAYECERFEYFVHSNSADLDRWQYSTDGTTWNDISGTFSGDHHSSTSPRTLTFDAPITARYWSLGVEYGPGTGYLGMGLYTWRIFGTPTVEQPDTIGTTTYRPKRIAKDKSRRLGASQATVELANEDGGIGVSADSAVKANAPIRIYQWYGDAANEVLTFAGLIDEVHEGRDPRTVAITARDMMKRLIVQTFSATAPQGDGEDGAVRTAANGVYLDTDVDTILDDILDRAGWPTADRDITPSGFPLEEYIIADGSTWAEAIIGENALTGLTGYDAGVDEAGVFYFRPLTASAAPDSDTEPTPDYTYEVANADASNLTSGNVIRLDHEIDDYDLKTRVKVRGSLATAVPAFTELWHTNLFTLPVGVWYDPTQSTHLRVLDRGTKKIYNLVQATRAKDGTGIYPIDISGDVTYPLGLSGDPADADVFWVLEARWRVGGGNTASVHKYDASDGTHTAEYALPDGQWSDIKVSSGSIWLANYGDDLIYQRSKVDASAVASFTMTYAGTDQTAPTGIGVDGTTLALFFYGKARFLLVDESDPTTVDSTNALGVTSGRIKTGTTKLLGGEIDTDTDAHLYACSDDLGLVYKYALTEPSTSEVAIEVVDEDLEDELGFLAGAEDREHDTHPGDADHPFEIRRETLTLAKTITDLAQATETANRALAVLAHRREVVDVGTVGNPGIQLGDLHQLTDPVTGLDDLYVVDTYRDSMTLSSDGKGTYLATVAYVPYSPSY
jgi:hypothetical protein